MAIEGSTQAWLLQDQPEEQSRVFCQHVEIPVWTLFNGTESRHSLEYLLGMHHQKYLIFANWEELLIFIFHEKARKDHPNPNRNQRNNYLNPQGSKERKPKDQKKSHPNTMK